MTTSRGDRRRGRLSGRPSRRPVVATAPWTRGPLLLLREPMAVLAVAGAALVLALAVAAGPLFVSSVGTAGLHAAAAKECVQDNQISVLNPRSFPLWAGFQPAQTPEAVSRADPLVQDAFAGQGLPAPVLSTYTAVPTGAGSPEQPDLLGLLATPGAVDHVTVLSRVPGAGIYLTDTYAAARGLRAGDRLSLASGRRLPIAGVYRDLDTASYRTVLPDFWCHWRNLIVSTVSNQPPPLALADRAIVAAQGAEVAAEWTSPIDVDALTVAEARAAATAGDRLLSPAQTDEDDPGSVLSGYAERTNLDFNLPQTDKLQGAVGIPVLAIAAAGAVLSMVLVTGAVLFWVRRRRAELTMLSARGVGPAALGAKAVAELALPAAAGCAVGWGSGLWLVPVLGPSPLTEPGAPGRALRAVGVALAVSLVVMLVVAAVTLGERRVRASAALRFVPPLLVVGLLGAAWALFGAADPSRLVLLGVYRVDPALLLAPLLALAGVVLAAALSVAAPLGRARVAVRRRGVAVFAAVNRAAAARGAVVVVLCGLAVPVGLAVYAAGFTASTQATVTAKTEVYAGAPVTIPLRVGLGRLPDPGAAATPVSYALGDATGAARDTDGEVQLLGIDPRSLADYAYADEAVIGTPLPQLLQRLTARPAGRAVPALLVGGWTGPAPTSVQVRSSSLPVTVVGRVPAFPGIRYPYRPAVVVDIGAVAGMDFYGPWENELWTDQAHAGAVLSNLAEQGILTEDVEQPDGVLDALNLLPVTWTFQFLQVVSILVALISVAGLLLFLAARQQRQQVSYVLLRRMGMTRRSHLGSLLLELGGLAGWAWLTGALTGTGALLTATRTIDVNRGFLPPTLLRLPTATLIGTGLGLAGVAALLAWWTQRHAERIDPAAVLRT